MSQPDAGKNVLDAQNPAIPALPPDATPEEKDQHWLKYHYQGDKQKQLTVRAVLMGSFLGLFMAMSNLYTTLKLGWSFAVVVTAVVLSYVIWNALRMISGWRLSPMSMLENNCMASTASAAGYSTGAALGTAVGALLLITGQHMHWLPLACWVFFSAGLGVFLAIPMKRQMVNHEQLPFPSGTAAAVTLRSLYSAGKEAMHKAYALLVTLIIGVVVGVLRTYGTLVDEMGKTKWSMPWLAKLKGWLYIPEDWAFAGFLNPLTRGKMSGLSLEPSVLLIGAGMIVGNRVNLSMLGGSILLYYIVAPQMLAHDLVNAGVVGYVPAFTVNPEGNFNPVRWALWGGTSLMVFASLTTLALDWRSVVRAFTGFRRKSGGTHNAQLDAIEVPNSWLAMGFIPFGFGLVVVMYLAFHISIPLGIVAVLMSSVISLVCCRVTGETDTTPVGPMGKLTQLLYAVLPGAAGNTTINLMTAGATAAAGMGSADLLADLKSGYLLGANPRKQFWAQFIGVFIGTLAIVPAWYLMVPNKEALEKFNPPAVNMWRAVAELLTQGLDRLPISARYLILIGSALGILLPMLERIFPKARPYMPSAMGLGLAWVVPFQNSLSFAIGGAVVWLWTKWDARNSDKYAIPVASGFIAGESIIAAMIAIACTLVGFLAAK